MDSNLAMWNYFIFSIYYLQSEGTPLRSFALKRACFRSLFRVEMGGNGAKRVREFPYHIHTRSTSLSYISQFDVLMGTELTRKLCSEGKFALTRRFQYGIRGILFIVH